MQKRIFPFIASVALAALLPTGSALAHDGHDHGDAKVVSSVPLKLEVEKKGPVKVAAFQGAAPKFSGQGYWKFVAAKDLTPVPTEAQPFVKGAHGTVLVDNERDIVYWGLENVGWIGFSNKLSQSWVVKGDEALTKGNLHGADIFPRRGQLPLIAAADNAQGEIYLSDTTFKNAQVLKLPDGEPYADKKGFAPTDVTFVKKDEIYVTDGYGKAWFMPASTSPLAYKGKFFGGKPLSQTPHGITLDKKDNTLLISARPEGEIKRWDIKKETLKEVVALPPGSTVCDVDIWGDYALAPCLNGPDKTPGPIYIVNLKKRAIVATIKPKVDLDYELAQHIHDACWYVTGKGSKREVYILFTNWNPGGVGALKLVNLP